MTTIVQIPQSLQSRIRFEANRIQKHKRPITRRNALLALDRALIKEALSAGKRRGAALSFADSFMDAVNHRIAELDKLAGQSSATVTRPQFQRKSA